MRKRLAVLGALTTAVLAVASSAAAYVTPPPDTSGVHSLITCLRSGGVIGGNADGKGAISSATDLFLTVGWGASTQSQVNNFLAAEYGSIVISNYDESSQTIGTPVRSISWGSPGAKKETDVSHWTAPLAVNDPRLNGGKPFWNSKFFWQVGPGLAGGSYWVSPDFELTKAMFDGSETIPRGPWFDTGCELVVSS